MSNPSLSTLLDMDEEEVFMLVDEEYGLSEKQKALNQLLDEMTEQLEKHKQRDKEMASELKRLKKANAVLRNEIKKMSQ